MRTELKWLTPEGVQNLMSHLIPYFERVVDVHPQGSFTVAGILFKLFRGEWTCWIITDEDDNLVGVSATCVTSDMMFRSVMRVLFLAGDGWLEWGPKMLNEFELSSSDKNIHAIEFVGRGGFQRKLPDYSLIGGIYRKVIKPDSTYLDVVKPNVLDVGTA